MIKKVNGKRVIKQFGSPEKRKRFSAEAGAAIAVNSAIPRASISRAGAQAKRRG
ncbi:hypothetical protein ACVIIV_004489 [Bradyrhizobium sp. USDA 4354]